MDLGKPSISRTSRRKAKCCHWIVAWPRPTSCPRRTCVVQVLAKLCIGAQGCGTRRTNNVLIVAVAIRPPMASPLRPPASRSEAVEVRTPWASLANDAHIGCGSRRSVVESSRDLLRMDWSNYHPTRGGTNENSHFINLARRPSGIIASVCDGLSHVMHTEPMIMSRWTLVLLIVACGEPKCTNEAPSVCAGISNTWR